MDEEELCTIELHNETQKEWEKRAKHLTKELEKHGAEIYEIKEVSNLLKKKIKSLPHSCASDATFNALNNKYDKMCEKYDNGQKDLSDIKVIQAKILEKLENKKEKDVARNGKVKELDDKEGKLSETVAAHTAELKVVSELQDKIWGLLKGMAVGLAIFFITFTIKTFVWGF